MPDVTRLAITPAELKAFDDWRSILNLHLHPPSAEQIWWKDVCGDLYTEIGHIVHLGDAGIHIHPYEDIHTDDLETLLGAAIDAASNKPCAREGWTRTTRNGRRGWQCTISTSTVPKHIATTIRAAENRRERNLRITNASESPQQQT